MPLNLQMRCRVLVSPLLLRQPGEAEVKCSLRERDELVEASESFDRGGCSNQHVLIRGCKSAGRGFCPAVGRSLMR